MVSEKNIIETLTEIGKQTEADQESIDGIIDMLRRTATELRHNADWSMKGEGIRVTNACRALYGVADHLEAHRTKLRRAIIDLGGVPKEE